MKRYLNSLKSNGSKSNVIQKLFLDLTYSRYGNASNERPDTYLIFDAFRWVLILGWELIQGVCLYHCFNVIMN